MRIALVLHLVVALVATMPRVADACFEPAFEQHALDRSQLADGVKPGPVSISMWIEEPGGGGCVTPSDRCAPAGRQLVVMVSASDDQTPPDKLGYRVTVTGGRAPFLEPGDVRPVDEQLRFALGDAEQFAFELSIRAIDLNGNVGPATYTQVANANAGGCASHSAGALSFGLVAIVLGFLVGRRRR